MSEHLERDKVIDLLDTLEKLLNGITYLRELTPRRVLLERLKGLPAELAPLGVASVVPHVEPRLRRLGSADVVARGARCYHVSAADELHKLGGEPRGGVGVHFVARLAERLGQRHVLRIVLAIVLRAVVLL